MVPAVVLTAEPWRFKETNWNPFDGGANATATGPFGNACGAFPPLPAGDLAGSGGGDGYTHGGLPGAQREEQGTEHSSMDQRLSKSF